MNKRTALIGMAVVALGISSSPVHAQASTSDDRQKIVGVWSGGMPGEPKGSIELVITPTKITGRNARTGQSLGEGTYELDSAKKTIDARGIENPVRSRTYLGVYSLDGNTLR